MMRLGGEIITSADPATSSRRQGRKPGRHGAGDRELRGHHGDPPSARRRGAARRRVLADPGHQRRRRQPRAPDPDAVRPVHAQAEEQAPEEPEGRDLGRPARHRAPSTRSSMRWRASAPPSCRCRPRAWSCRPTSTGACARNSAATWCRCRRAKATTSLDRRALRDARRAAPAVAVLRSRNRSRARDCWSSKKIDAVYVTRFQKERWAEKDQAYPRIDRKFLNEPKYSRRQRDASACRASASSTSRSIPTAAPSISSRRPMACRCAWR